MMMMTITMTMKTMMLMITSAATTAASESIIEGMEGFSGEMWKAIFNVGENVKQNF